MDNGRPVPCSKKCYLSVSPKKEKVDLNSGGKSKNLSVEVDMGILKKERTEWTPHEEAIYNLLRKTGEDDFCRISIYLNQVSNPPKTCREVYEYASRNAPISPRVEHQASPVKKYGINNLFT